MLTTLLFSPEDFINQFPEFAPCDRDIIEGYIRQSMRECPLSVWGLGNRLEAVAWLTAYKLAGHLFQTGAIAGSAISASKGDNQALPSGETKVREATFYGQEFQAIKDSLPLTGFVI